MKEKPMKQFLSSSVSAAVQSRFSIKGRKGFRYVRSVDRQL